MTHFVHPSIAVELSAAVLDECRQTASAHRGQSSPLLFGLKWAPASIALDASCARSCRSRPALICGTSTDTVGSHRRQRVDAIGARRTAGTGANWYLSRHFALQLEGDYHAVPAFDAVNGTRRNVSGFALSAGLGIAWGGR